MNTLLKHFLCFILLAHFQLPILGQDLRTEDLRTRDPLMGEAEGRFYQFLTALEIAVWSSTDMENWEKAPVVRSSPPDWATEVVSGFTNHLILEGKYSLYYSISASGKTRPAIGLAVGNSHDPSRIDYVWKDQELVIQGVKGSDMRDAIDPILMRPADIGPEVII